MDVDTELLKYCSEVEFDFKLTKAEFVDRETIVVATTCGKLVMVKILLDD